MLLYELEESLGNYVRDNEGAISLGNSGYSDVNIGNELEKSYLDDIFKLAIAATQGTSSENHVKHLYRLAHDLSLFEIRNAIAHPNRTFFNCYWYRVAAICSDPAFERLGIKELMGCLYSAENNTIEDPPEGWEDRYKWEIPNNLPATAESDVTGLIGRNKEHDYLTKKLKSPRTNTLAIVAPGGFGKTALAIDLLKSIVSSPSSTDWVDGVCYCSLKVEELTQGGAKKIASDFESLQLEDQVRKILNDVFDENFDNIREFIASYADKRLLICIDNLETILRDSPEVFEEVVDLLPQTWKVLVTSRVTITNAYIHTLSELPERSAEHLARLYNKNRGGEELENSRYLEIAKLCYCNPLAIRLTIDLILSGNEIPDSISQAKSSISEFSFKNLIDSLPDLSVQVLELIFIRGVCDRRSVCEILGCNPDQAAEALSNLFRTSLIKRISSKDDVESYQVNGSVEELLAYNPKNLLVREKIQQKISSRKAIATQIDVQQRVNKTPSWHIDFIPVDTDDALKIILQKSNRAFKKRELLAEAYKEFKEKYVHYSENEFFLRAYALILLKLQLIDQAEVEYKKAVSASDNPLVMMYGLGRFYHSAMQPEKAVVVYRDILSDFGRVELVDDFEDFERSVYQGYYLGLIYTGEFLQVIEETKKWKELGHLKGIVGTFRATAFKRKLELEIHSDHEGAKKSLNSALKITDEVLSHEGYAAAFCVQAFKLVEEIIVCFVNQLFRKNNVDLARDALVFCDKHLLDIVDGPYVSG